MNVFRKNAKTTTYVTVPLLDRGKDVVKMAADFDRNMNVLRANTFASNSEEPIVAPDPVRARGIGLRLSEWSEIDETAHHLGMTPHALAAHAVRDWLKRYYGGEIELETRAKLK